MIYADNAATTKLNMKAFEEMKPFLIEHYGNASQPYIFSRIPKNALKTSRKIIAKCINADPEEIFFTSGGTESDNWAVKGFILSNNSKKEIYTSQIEHHAILRACRTIEEVGYPVVYLPVNKQGILTDKTLKEMITDGVGLVSVMLVNNEIGTIEPISDLAAITHEYGGYFHTDAVQAVGHIPVDVKKLGIDMLSASAHKFNGPKGIGFLYIKKNSPIHIFMDGGYQELGMRAGTENVASVVGMASALSISCSKLESTTQYLHSLEKKFLERLQENKVDFILNGAAERSPGNMSISIKNASGEMLLHRLDLMGICVSTGSACNSNENNISHVLQAIQVPQEYIKGTIRVSLGFENTVEEVIRIADCIAKIVRK